MLILTLKTSSSMEVFFFVYIIFAKDNWFLTPRRTTYTNDFCIAGFVGLEITPSATLNCFNDNQSNAVIFDDFSNIIFFKFHVFKFYKFCHFDLGLLRGKRSMNRIISICTHIYQHCRYIWTFRKSIAPYIPSYSSIFWPLVCWWCIICLPRL